VKQAGPEDIFVPPLYVAVAPRLQYCVGCGVGVPGPIGGKYENRPVIVIRARVPAFTGSDPCQLHCPPFPGGTAHALPSGPTQVSPLNVVRLLISSSILVSVICAPELFNTSIVNVTSAGLVPLDGLTRFSTVTVPGVGVSVGVAVGAGVSVGVLVATDVSVGVLVPTGVTVGIGVGIGVGTAVGTRVGTRVGGRVGTTVGGRVGGGCGVSVGGGCGVSVGGGCGVSVGGGCGVFVAWGGGLVVDVGVGGCGVSVAVSIGAIVDVGGAGVSVAIGVSVGTTAVAVLRGMLVLEGATAICLGVFVGVGWKTSTPAAVGVGALGAGGTIASSAVGSWSAGPAVGRPAMLVPVASSAACAAGTSGAIAGSSGPLPHGL
jgi:hypothetical protein